MKKLLVVLALASVSTPWASAQAQLKGFTYGPLSAPTGQEWQNPELIAFTQSFMPVCVFGQQLAELIC